MRIPDELLECVVFLCVDTGRGQNVYGGTAFLVSLPFEGQPDLAHFYHVTAKHNLERARNIGTLSMRLNKKNGDSVIVPLDGAEWFESDDADVAITYDVPLDGSDLEFAHLDINGFADDEIIEEKRIGVGDELAIVGLFGFREGIRRNIPIVRVGNIAATPVEPLQDPNTGTPYDAYLAEVRSLGGLSGSPVFVNTGGLRWDGKNATTGMFPVVLYLLGLVRGHWDIRPRKTESAQDYADWDGESVNVGIATITPITKLLELLNREDVVRQRRASERERSRRTPD